jgi:hypothetical protein
VYRNYGQFSDLQVLLKPKILAMIYLFFLNIFFKKSKLSKVFKKEIKSGGLSKNELPELPGNVFFGRNNVKSKAIERLGPVNTYCQVF